MRPSRRNKSRLLHSSINFFNTQNIDVMNEALEESKTNRDAGHETTCYKTTFNLLYLRIFTRDDEAATFGVLPMVKSANLPMVLLVHFYQW